MPKGSQSEICLYDYGKLNTNSMFRRLLTDTQGQQLHEWISTDEDPDPAAKWRWIQT